MKKFSLQKSIEIMLEASKDNPDTKEKAKFMSKWIRKYFRGQFVNPTQEVERGK